MHPKVVALDTIFTKIGSPLLNVLLIFLLDHLNNDICSFIEYSSWPLSSSKTFLSNICKTSDWGYVLIVELIPSVKTLRVKVRDVVEAIEGDKTTQYIEICLLFVFNLALRCIYRLFAYFEEVLKI